MKLLDTAGVTTLWGKVKDHVKTSIDSQQFKTINGTSVKGAGDIHIDLTLYKVVSALPTSGIDATKIYLVKDSSVDDNLYSEYKYVDEKWEKLGSFRSSVDLEPYAKTDYVNAQLATKVDKQSGKGLSTNDFTTAEKNKLANISAGANNYSLPLATSDVRGGAKIGYTTDSSNRNYAVQLSNEQMYVNVPWTDTNTTYGLATSTNNGLMKASDKNKLDDIDPGANNYKLPVASANSIGGIKTSVDYDQYHCFPICTDKNSVAYTKIDSISLFNGSVNSYTATEDTNYTVYSCNEINNKGGDGINTLRFPLKSGTLALTSDIPDVPDVSNLCKINLTYDISKCKEGSINVFVNNSSKDFSVDSIKDKGGMVVFAYVVGNCNITANVDTIIYNNVPNYTGKVSVTPGMFLIIPNVNSINIFSF